MANKQPPDQPAPQPSQPAKTSRIVVRELFEQMSDPLDEFSLPDLTDRVMATVQGNPELLKQFLDEHLRQMVYEVGMNLLGDMRARARRLEDAQALVLAAVTNDNPMTRLRAARRSGAGFDWLREPILVAPGRYVRMALAKREDLDAAIELGKNGIRSIQVKLAYETLVRDGLAAGQAVGDRYSQQELMALYARAEAQPCPQKVEVLSPAT